MARQPHQPDDKSRKQVLLMAGIGLTHDQIAKVMLVSDETLRKYYANELETGAAKMSAAVAQNLYNIATSKDSGAVAAAIFWMKTRAGWRETNRSEITGADGGPVKVETKTVSTKNMTPEQRAALREILLSAKEN